MFRLRPGFVINVSEYSDLVQFYDKTFVANLKNETPFVNQRETREMFVYPGKSIRTCNRYETHIATGNEKILTILPYAALATLIGIIIISGFWILQILR